jgi:Putative modulator of DNA gyrase.
VRRVDLNFGYAKRYDNQWEIRYSVRGLYIDVRDTVDSPAWGIEAVARKIEREAMLRETTGREYQELADFIRSGGCVAVCKTGAIFSKPTCEEAKAYCETWQGGFVRFATAEEFEEKARRYFEEASKMREDVEKIRSLLTPAPPPTPTPTPPTPTPTPPTPTPVPTPPFPEIPREIPEEVKEKIEEAEKIEEIVRAKPTLLDVVVGFVKENWLIVLIGLLVLVVLLK